MIHCNYLVRIFIMKAWWILSNTFFCNCWVSTVLRKPNCWVWAFILLIWSITLMDLLLLFFTLLFINLLLYAGQYTTYWIHEVWSCFIVFCFFCLLPTDPSMSILPIWTLVNYIHITNANVNSNALAFHKQRLSLLPPYSNRRYSASFIKHLTYAKLHYILVHILFARMWSYNYKLIIKSWGSLMCLNLPLQWSLNLFYCNCIAHKQNFEHTLQHTDIYWYYAFLLHDYFTVIII